MKLVEYNHDYINAERDLSNTRPSNKFREKLLDAMSLNWTGAVVVTSGETVSKTYTAPSNGDFLAAYYYKHTVNIGTTVSINSQPWFWWGYGDAAYADGGMPTSLYKNDVLYYTQSDTSKTPIARLEYFIPTKGVTNA